MTGFAGWDMPLQYDDGILQSHLHCREKASLFDVSHMGQIRYVCTPHHGSCSKRSPHTFGFLLSLHSALMVRIVLSSLRSLSLPILPDCPRMLPLIPSSPTPTVASSMILSSLTVVIGSMLSLTLDASTRIRLTLTLRCTLSHQISKCLFLPKFIFEFHFSFLDQNTSWIHN